MPNPIATLFLSLVLVACAAPTQQGAAATTPASTVPAQSGTPGALRAALALVGHRWRLVDARDAGGRRIDALFVREDKPLHLDFNASLVSIGNGCGTMSAHHALTGDSLTVEPMATLPGACTDKALLALDREIGNRLQGRLAMRIDEGDAPTLVLTNAAGDVLTFNGMAESEPL